MRGTRFRLRVNQEVREADIVVGTRAAVGIIKPCGDSGWSINVQRGQIVAMGLVGGGKGYVSKNLDLNMSRLHRLESL